MYIVNILCFGSIIYYTTKFMRSKCPSLYMLLVYLCKILFQSEDAVVMWLINGN